MQSSPGPRLALEDELLVVMPLWLCSRPLLLPTPLPGASKPSQRSNTPSHDGAFIGQALWYLSCMCPELLQPLACLLSAACCVLAMCVQSLASTKSMLLCYLLFQSLPPFLECQPKSALHPSSLPYPNSP